VYLEVSAEEVARRLHETASRPLMNGEKAPAALLAERRAWYEEVASVRLDTSGLALYQVVARLRRLLFAKGVLP
jgi:shikimate kinase